MADAELRSDGRLRGAFGRYRVMAYVVGVMLLLLVAAMVVKYVGGHPFLVRVVAPIHGFLYIAYLVVALDLASKARWSLRRTVLVLLAGTVPFCSFVMERRVEQDFRSAPAAF